MKNRVECQGEKNHKIWGESGEKTSCAWVTRSWDRFLIPKPFSRILVRFGEPIDVPEQMDSEAFEALRRKVEKEMIDGHAQDDLSFGWEKPL